MTLPELLSSWIQALKEKFTVKLQVALLLAASFAVQVTVVTPSGKVEPDGGLHTTVGTPEQLSLAVGVANVATLPVMAGQAGAATMVMFARQVIEGGWLSLTVTVKVPVPVLLLASVTEQVTVVTPFWKVVPLAGVQVTLPTAEQLSLAVGVV
jgi:hypothetical protein